MSSTKLNLSAVKVEVGSETLLACRICLVTDVKLYNIQEWGLDQVFVDLMGTTLSVWDGFPQHLCTYCRALLVKSNELRERCRKVEGLLKESLMYQHFVTMRFIRSIDRKGLKLTHPFSHVGSNRDVRHFNHDDIQKSTQTDHHDIGVFLIENDIDNDVKDFDLLDIDELKTEVDSEKINTDLETDGGQNSLEVNVVEIKEKNKDVAQSLKRKKVVRKKGEDTGEVQDAKRKKVEVKTETEKPKRKTKKKRGRSWRLKPFCTPEDFQDFEEKYNFKVIALSEEEMVKEMEERRDSDNYKYSVVKCELCLKGFLSSVTYNNHLKAHDEETRKYECKLCHLRYHFPALLRSHMHRAHQLKFRCLQCKDVIKNKNCAVLHAAFHAGTTFKCKYCDMTFLKKTSRSTHMRMEHPREVADDGTCEICGETFTSALGLKTHKTRTHNTRPTMPKLLCRICKVRFDTMEAIEEHRKTKGKCDGTLRACATCGATFANEQELLSHRMAEHGLQLFSCDTCGKSFESKDSVGIHIDRVHYNIKPRPPARPGFKQKPRIRGKRPNDSKHVCEHCGKQASCMATLKQHMTQHTGERPYKCNLCPKTYRSALGLNSHEAFHTGARKYRCPDCPAAFMHQSSLYQHRKAQIHSGEKAYQCKICEKTFTQSGSLHTHIKYVHMKVKPPPRKRNKKTAS